MRKQPRMSRSVGSMVILFVLGLLLPGSVSAQETGAITGQVVESSTADGLDGVQVYVVGENIGTLTDSDGNFRLTEVPSGELTVAAQLLGYGTERQTVTVQPGQAAQVQFQMSQQAVAMDQIVVTGTGTGGVERRQLGNTVGSVNAEELQDAPTASFSEMLSGREPGVSMMPSSGLTGEGARIRIRGSASLSQSNEPLVYIDGVRMSSGGGFAGGVSGGSTGVGASSRLDDISPSSIERIEILKGAAAATLYGTEASNGVIQIFTKSGSEGATRWTVEAENGMEFMPTNRILPFADFPRDQAQAQHMNEFWGEDLEPYEVMQRDLMDQIHETGRTTSLNGSVSGGQSGITYFGSARYQNLDGIWGLEELGPMNDRSERYQGNINLQIYPSDEMRLQLRSLYANTAQSSPQTSNTPASPHTILVSSHLRKATERNPFGAPVYATIEELMQQTQGQEVNHFNTSSQVTYSPGSDVTINGTVGVDFTSNSSFQQLPFGWNVDDFATIDTEGARSVGTENHMEITTELRTGWSDEFGDFTSDLTVGGQAFLVRTEVRAAEGSDFPGPGLEVVDAASNQTTDESYQENINAGMFAQEQIGFRDFAFVTLGGRYDANSAFGESFQGVFYPKVSFSVIPSDRPGWESSLLSSLRIRGAIGQSGLQPGAFDKFRTYDPLVTTFGPGIQTGNLGNADLEPEVATEWEGGVELGLFDERLGLTATYWDRTVDGAMVAQQFPVSGGFQSLQLTNIGELKGRGVDLTGNGTVYSGDDVSVEVFANAAYLWERVTDLGGAPDIKVGGSYTRTRNFIKEGYTPGAFFGAELQDVEYPLDIFNDCTQPSEQELLDYFSQPRDPSEFEVLPVDCGEPTMTEQYKGKPQPDWSGSFGTNVSFLDRFRLNTVFEYELGQQHQDLTGAFRQASPSIGRNVPRTAEVQSTMMDPASSPQDRLDAALTWARELRGLAPMAGMNQIWDADYLRWRELSLTYDTPESFYGLFGARSMSVSLRARNLTLTVNDAYRGYSPELETSARCDSGSTNCNFLMGQETARLPIPRRFVAAVRLGF